MVNTYADLRVRIEDRTFSRNGSLLCGSRIAASADDAKGRKKSVSTIQRRGLAASELIRVGQALGLSLKEMLR